MVRLLGLSGLLFLTASCRSGMLSRAPETPEISTKYQSYINIPFPTLGGKQCWLDCYHRDNWRIQYNMLTSHYRLLDEDNWRQAWGSYSWCKKVLDKKVPASNPIKNGITHIWYIPGIARSAHSVFGPLMEHLNTELINQNVFVQQHAVDYPSLIGPIDWHAQKVRQLIHRSSHKNDKHIFITHSMGGLVYRYISDASIDLNSEELQGITIFPPHQGARRADWWQDKALYKFVMGPAGQELTTENAAHIPLVQHTTHVIAGISLDDDGYHKAIPGNDDGTVGLSETYLENASHETVVAKHTFGTHSEILIQQVSKKVLEMIKGEP